jgi:hypothetical protein
MHSKIKTNIIINAGIYSFNIKYEGQQIIIKNNSTTQDRHVQNLCTPMYTNIYAFITGGGHDDK